MDVRLLAAGAVFGHRAAPLLQAGAQQPMFGGDFYDRIHFNAVAFDLGNVAGAQQRTVSVWNAHRRARTLEALVLEDADGITVTGQPSPPLQFAPLQERAYTIDIGVDGPPVILATITWEFDESETTSVVFTGTRVTAWVWAPNWASPMLERLEWMTDVIQSYRGEEQTRSLRLNPRQSLEFAVLLEAQERRHMEAALWALGARTWAVPLWFDCVEIGAALPIGSTSIAISTASRNFRAGSFGMLLGASSRAFEIVEIDAVNPSEVVLSRATLKAWPTGTRFFPVRAARIDETAAVSRFTGSAVDARFRFEMLEPEEYAASAGATTYRGYPVLTARPVWPEDPVMTFQRKLAIFDSGTGPVAVEDEAKMPIVEQAMRWVLDDRTEIDRHRKLLFALRGKAGRLWVPTWADDLSVASTIGESALAIDIEWAGYTQYHSMSQNRRDIRIETLSGAVLYRRITGAIELDESTERVSIDTALGVNLTPSDIVQVSFMALSRLASDAAEFDYFTGEVAETATTMRSTRHDV